MSVFVRASLQGTPKTSPGHVALHHMPGLPMNLQNSPPQMPMPRGFKPLLPLPPGPTLPLVSLLIPTPLGLKPLPLGLPGQARLVL